MWERNVGLVAAASGRETPVLIYLLCAIALSISFGASAERFRVNSCDWEFLEREPGDTNPGDGLALTEDGLTTLRAAVEEANALPGPDEISFNITAFDCPHSGWLFCDVYVSSNLEITEDLVLYHEWEEGFEWVEGGRAKIKVMTHGGDPDSAFVVAPGVHFTVRDIEIQSYTEPLPLNGGLFRVSTGAELNLDGVVLVAQALKRGGAIYNDGGTVFVRDSTFVLCSAGTEGGVIANVGGSIVLESIVSSAHSAGARGGFFHCASGSISGTDLYLYGESSDSGGVLHMEGGAVKLNRMRATGAGSAEGNIAIVEGGELTLSNGAIGPLESGEPMMAVTGGTATLVNCTVVVGATAGSGSVKVGSEGGFRIGNTIVTGEPGQPAPFFQVSGTFESLGGNLISVGDADTGFSRLLGDIVGTVAAPIDALLTGSTRTGWSFVPLPGSPARDGGRTELITAEYFGPPPHWDRRGEGYARVCGQFVDIGETELQGTHHAADANEDGMIDFGELLRVVQFFNAKGLHCNEESEDGFTPGPGNTSSCDAHDLDYNPRDWRINLSELLRLVQMYTMGSHYLCPGSGTEDGFCLEAGR